jgi:hypothetical protein
VALRTLINIAVSSNPKPVAAMAQVRATPLLSLPLFSCSNANVLVSILSSS